MCASPRYGCRRVPGSRINVASHRHQRVLVRVAVLLSVLFLICAIAAFFGVPAVQVGGEPVVGLRGLVVGLVAAAAPLVVVLGWRKMQAK